MRPTLLRHINVLRIFLIACLGVLLLAVPHALAFNVSGGVDDEGLSQPDTAAVEETVQEVQQQVPSEVPAPPPEVEAILGKVRPVADEAPVGVDVTPTTQSDSDARVPLVPDDTATAMVAAAGGVGLLFALKGLFGMIGGRLIGFPLFSRIKTDDLLENEARDALYQLVEQNPGIGLMELSEMSGLGWGTTVYHMTRLQQANLVASMKNGQNRHFFKNGHPAARSKKAVAVLKNDTAGSVAKLVMATPGVTQVEIGRQLGLGAPTVTKYVKRLESEGLLSTVQDGRTKLVHATPGLVEVLGHLEPTPAMPPAMATPEPLAIVA